MDEKLEERWLPEGGYELRSDGCVPVVLTADTYFGRTEHQRWQIIRLLAIYAGYFADSQGLPLPLTGRFREAGAEFVFEDDAGPASPFAALRVPRRIVVSGEASSPSPPA